MMPSKVERTEAEKKTKWYFVYGYFRDFDLSDFVRKVLPIIAHYSLLNIQLDTSGATCGAQEWISEYYLPHDVCHELS